MSDRRASERRLTQVLSNATAPLLGYLQRRVGFDDAADLLVETMVTVWRRSAELPSDDERARMWLFGIARGTLRNHERGERRREALAVRIQHHTARGMVAPAADAGSEVRDALERIDPDLAELVRLVHWERFSIAEAAEILQIPASTARGRYQAAKTAIRAELFDDESPATGPSSPESTGVLG